MRRRLPRWTAYRSAENWATEMEERERKIDERIALYERILKEDATE